MPKKANQARNTSGSSSLASGAVQSKGAKRRARRRAAGANGNSQYTAVPVNFAKSMYSGKPLINGRSSHSIVVSHREFVCDVTSYVNFTLMPSRNINPGIDSMFPWLGSIARKYESYIFRRLSFIYEPFVSSATAGVIYMAIDYDAKDSDPVTKTELTGYANCVKSQLWAPCRFDANPLDLQKFAKERYTRGEALPANSAVQSYDVGKFICATYGGAGGGLCGEIYVDFEVELITPQADVDSEFLESAQVVAGGEITKIAPFGSIPVYSGGLPITALNDTITIKEPGQYLFSMNFGGTGITADTAPTLDGSTQRTTYVSSKTNATQTYGTYSARVNVTEPNQTLMMDFTPVATTITALRAALSRFSYVI